MRCDEEHHRCSSFLPFLPFYQMLPVGSANYPVHYHQLLVLVFSSCFTKLSSGSCVSKSYRGVRSCCFADSVRCPAERFTETASARGTARTTIFPFPSSLLRFIENLSNDATCCTALSRLNCLGRHVVKVLLCNMYEDQFNYVNNWFCLQSIPQLRVLDTHYRALLSMHSQHVSQFCALPTENMHLNKSQVWFL